MLLFISRETACISEVLFSYLLCDQVCVRVHMWLSQQNSAVMYVRVCVCVYFSFLCLVIVIQLSPAPAPSQRAGIIQSIALSPTAPFCTLLTSSNSLQLCCYTFTLYSSILWRQTFVVSQRETGLGRKVSILLPTESYFHSEPHTHCVGYRWIKACAACPWPDLPSHFILSFLLLHVSVPVAGQCLCVFVCAYACVDMHWMINPPYSWLRRITVHAAFLHDTVFWVAFCFWRRL